MSGFKARENDGGDMVLTKKYYEELLESRRWLQCLEDAGVDNWSGGYDYAREMFNRESK